MNDLADKLMRTYKGGYEGLALGLGLGLGLGIRRVIRMEEGRSIEGKEQSEV